MKEIGPIAGIDCKNTMTEINHAEGIDLQNITKMIIKESIIVHFRTMEIGENTKIVIKTNIVMKFSMIMIDLMIWIILKAEIGPMTETGLIVETGTTPKDTKETGLMLEIDYMTEMIHVVEIDHTTTVEMSIRKKNHKYKRRSRDYYKDAYEEDGCARDKYKHQYRNERYEKIRGRPKEKPCPHGDKIVIVYTQSLKNCTKSCHG